MTICLKPHGFEGADAASICSSSGHGLSRGPYRGARGIERWVGLDLIAKCRC